MVVSMVYYGLSLNTGNLGGNFYLNFTLSGLVEFPAYTLCLLLLDRVGRKWLHCVVMVVGGVACISTVFTTIYGGGGRFHHSFTWRIQYNCKCNCILNQSLTKQRQSCVIADFFICLR